MQTRFKETILYKFACVFHYNHYEWTRRHDNEVNDQAVDDDDDDSLSLDQSFVVHARTG